MTGKKRGGQVGNLNAAKDILPALRRLRRGRPLPAGLTRVAAQADAEAQLLVSDKGGLDGMTGGERLLLNVWRTARQATLLILSELIERGAVTVDERGRWDLQPGAQRLAKFLDSERAALVALGLERRAKDITPRLQDYLASRCSKPAGEDRETRDTGA